jgi:hypothetical protein
MASKLFISYSRKDEYFARALAVDLEESGAEIWIDVDDIPVGSRWSAAIQQGLRESQVMLLIISQDAMSSRNVEDEWNYFLDKHKPIVILYWRSCEPHFQLWRAPRIEFRPHKAEYPAAFAQLVGLLRQYDLFLTPPKELPSSSNSFVRKALGKAIEAALAAEQENPRAQTDRYKRSTFQDAHRALPKGWGWLAASIGLAIFLILSALTVRWQSDRAGAAHHETATPNPSLTLPVPTIPSVTGDLQITPSLPADPPTLALVYNDEAVYLLNISQTNQNISRLRFVQVSALGQRAEFMALEWGESGPLLGGDSLGGLRPGHCFQVATTIQAAQKRPSDCRQMNSWLYRGLQESHFWLPLEAASDSFRVFQEADEVASCPLSAGRCEFHLGQPGKQ